MEFEKKLAKGKKATDARTMDASSLVPGRVLKSSAPAQ